MKARRDVSMTPPNLEVSQNIENNRAEKRAIPKFASFKRSDPDTSDRQKDGLARKQSIWDTKDRGQSSSKSRSRGQDDHRAEGDASKTRTSSPRPTHKRLEERPQLYVIDRIGDSKNLTFGTLDRQTTSQYFRYGAGKVLGCPVAQRISQSISNEKGLILAFDDYRLREGGNRQAIWKAARTRTKHSRIKPKSNNETPIDLQADFIPLSIGQRSKRERGNDSPGLRSSLNSDAEDEHYRSIDGRAKTKGGPQEEDLTDAEDLYSSSGGRDTSTFKADNSVMNKRSELSKKIDEDPTNYDAWLDLLTYQDRVLGLNSTSKRASHTNAERKSNAEVKLSMYDKALEKVKHPADRERLLLGKMQEAARVWDNQKLFSEWQSMLDHYPEYLTLWKGYLDYIQGTFASFRYEQVRESYYKCLDLLKRIDRLPEGICANGKKNYDVQNYVLLRLTTLMRESGFAEHSVAAWQALLEYNFFRPLDLHGSEYDEGGSLHGNAVSRFEQFWDSEVPRIGEVGCDGWIGFDQANGPPPEPKVNTTDYLENAQNPWESWVKSEHDRSLLAREPAHTVDDVAEDDPYRVILFSDIQPFLFESPSDVTRAACLDAFLVFCQLPPYENNNASGKSRSLWTDGYLCNEGLNFSSYVSQSFMREHSAQEALKTPPGSTSSRRAVFDLAISEYRLSSDTLFAQEGSWFSAFDAWWGRSLDSCGPLETAWVLRTLQQLVATGAGGDGLAEYLLALELRISPETVQRTAKSLLKRRPTSLLLYNAYALVEHRLGNVTKADKTLHTAITLCKTLDETTRKESLLLWRTWIWETLMAGKGRRALELLFMYGDEKTQTDGTLSDTQISQPTLLLRAERTLMSTRDRLISLGFYKHAAFAVDCLVVLNYLKSDWSLAAAALVFQSNCAKLTTYIPSRDPIQEHLHQSFARLLYYYVTHTNLIKPKEIRTLLAESIVLFPQNTIFLSLYAGNETRFRIDDRVRSIVNDVVLAGPQGQRQGQSSKQEDEQSVVPYFFALHTEFSRGVAFGSNASTIRSTFERAVDDGKPGAHCAGLWKLYFMFEHSRGDVGKAKSVFWRGVRACPWVKELYLLAFDYLRGPGGLDQEELRGVYDLMGEKELRIHVNLEDMADGR